MTPLTNLFSLIFIGASHLHFKTTTIGAEPGAVRGWGFGGFAETETPTSTVNHAVLNWLTARLSMSFDNPPSKTHLKKNCWNKKNSCIPQRLRFPLGLVCCAWGDSLLCGSIVRAYAVRFSWLHSLPKVNRCRRRWVCKHRRRRSWGENSSVFFFVMMKMVILIGFMGLAFLATFFHLLLPE